MRRGPTPGAVAPGLASLALRSGSWLRSAPLAQGAYAFLCTLLTPQDAEGEVPSETVLVGEADPDEGERLQ